MWISRGIETLWLLTVILVPLTFVSRDDLVSSSAIAFLEVPKIAVLRTLVALMAMLWLVEWGIKGGIPISSLIRHGIRPGIRPGDVLKIRPKIWLPALGHWLSNQPVRWLIMAVAVFGSSTILSTVLSTSFSVSMWGQIPGEDGYATYTVASYLLLFGVVTAHLNTKQQLLRLAGAIVIMGLLVSGYSVLQHYDHDFLGLIEPPRLPDPITSPRSTSTMGNAILAGAVMLMTIPITLVAATLTLNVPVRSGGFWLKAVLWASILTVLLLGLIFTLGRGAWGGTALAVTAYLGMLVVFIGWRTFSKVALLFLIAGAATWAILEIQSFVQGGDGNGTEETVVNQVSELASTVVTPFTTQGFRGGFAGRIEIWEGAWDLITTRPWFDFESLSLSPFRTVIGYGPDLFRYTYLLESPVRPVDGLPGEPVHAHNYFIHQGVELGFFGLLASLGLFGSVFIVGGFQLLKRRQSISLAHRLVLAALLAAFIGRFAEQIVGIARVSDLTIFWVLLAIFATLPRTMADHGQGQGSEPPSKAPVRPSGGRTGALTAGNPDRWMYWGQLVLVAALIVGIGAVTWVKTINYPRAGIVAAQAVELARDGDLHRSLPSLARAIDLAPDVPNYHNRRANVFSALRQSVEDGTNASGSEVNDLEQICGLLGGEQSYEFCLASQTYGENRAGSEHRPLNFRSKLALADSALELARLGNDNELVDKVLRAYRELTQLVPQSWPLHNALAAAYLELGQPERAVKAAQQSLAINQDANTNFQAMVVRGLAHLQLRRPESAIADFDEVIRLQPQNAAAYNNRGLGFQALGDMAKALQDFDTAINGIPGFERQSNFAEASNNRGLIYLGLGQTEKALLDFDEAIRIDPDYAVAYNNRGLASSALGQNEQAVRDYDEAIQLNPGYVLAYINRGVAYLNLGMPGAVVEDADVAISLDPVNSRAYALRALGNTLLGDEELARVDADRATQLGFDGAVLEGRMNELRNQP